MTKKTHNRTDESLIALRRILRATVLVERDLARVVGRSPAQLRVLQLVAEISGTTPKTLATQMGVSQATMSALVDKLEAAGLVQRVPSAQDRRQINVLATTLGLDRLLDAPDALQQRYVRAFAKLADWEQEQLASSMERVADMLGAQDIDASPVLTTGDIRAGKKTDGGTP
jgi:DNA-binding MarR family transcriptional regulator